MSLRVLEVIRFDAPMIRFLLVLICVICKVSLAQSNDTINFTDENGLKQGYWVLTNDIKKLPNYKDNAKVEEGSFVDNRKSGIWITYYPNGNKKSEITFINNSPRGHAIMYFEDGKKQEEGMWENNRWTGDYKMYHPNGQLFYEFKYNKTGKREGDQTYYYDNGKVMMKGNMSNGKESGVWEEYYENGDLKAKKAFNGGVLDPANTETYAPKNTIVEKKDEPIKDAPPAPKVDPTKDKKNEADKVIFNGTGYAKLFNLNKQISKDGTFKNYKLIDGKDYIYSKDGILIQIAVYKNGLYVGDAPLEEAK